MRLGLITLLIFCTICAFGRIVPSFTCDVVSGCSPLVVNITDHTTGATSWSWNLGNGNSATQQNPAATYLNPGTYTITLTASDGQSADTATRTITVFAKATVNFAADQVRACPGDTVSFTAMVTPGSAGISQYAWGFGNGIASSAMNPGYRYSLPGDYDVTLVVQDSNSCVANLTRRNFIHVSPAPVAAFTPSPAVTCGTSQNVTFTNQSTGGALTYRWTFGDSTIAASAAPSHLYQYGKYRATLTVTDSNGCRASATKNIAVINLHAAFVADKQLICAGEEVSFENRSPMSGTAWWWTFGDGGNSNKQNPKHIYTTPGVYTVTFTVKDATCRDSISRTAFITVTQGFSLSMDADNRNSCVAPFTVNFTSQTTGAGVSYAWDFGDGHTSNDPNPTNVYHNSSTFNVTLTAVDTNGCKEVLPMPGFITTSRPWTKFTCDTLTCPGAAVRFVNRTTGASKYLWQFGDGDTSTATNPAHSYRSYGRFNVSLTAIDTSGCDSTLVKNALIKVDSAAVDFHVDRTFSPCPPLVSVFSSVSNRNDLKYTWDFGDGYKDTAANPTHIFFHPGVYTVKLIGTSKLGCTDTIVYPDLITVLGPTGTFSMTPDRGCGIVPVQFSGSVSSSTKSIVCDLGDGHLYNDSLNFTYSYTQPRTYHPKFILTDAIGCSVPYDLDSVRVGVSPVMHLRDTNICPGQTVRVALGTDRYSWIAKVCDTCGRVPNIQDTTAMLVATPAVTTTYTVTATTPGGCTATDHFTVQIASPPVFPVFDSINACMNESIKFPAIQADSVRWFPASYLSSATALAPICTPGSSITYTVTAYNSSGCAASQQVPVKILSHVYATLSGDTAVCGGSQVQLHLSLIDTSYSGASYQWLADGSVQSSTDPIITAGQSTQIVQVITRSGTCIPDTDRVMIHVNPAPSVKLPGNTLVTQGAEVHIAAEADGASAYMWSAKDTLSCADCRVTTLVPRCTQMVAVTVANQYGCTASDSMQVRVQQCDPASVFIPNTFTPNGDGSNDVLYVRSRTLAHIESFRIFDRWGGMIFEGKDLEHGWDGTANGTPVEQGVYIYALAGKCEAGYDIEANGSVTLIR